MRRVFLAALMQAVWLLTGALGVYADEAPRLVRAEGRTALLVDGKPFFMLGVQMGNSSEWAATLPAVWRAVEKVHANTVGAPVYWERVEATPGRFDFSDVDQLLAQAREHNVHLLLLWFGASKNGQMHYAPAWVKTNTVTYPRIVDENGKRLDILDPTVPATLEADTRAYKELMHHLREVDGAQHTVLMVQVENEAGSYYASRDFSPRGNRLFDQPVPDALQKQLHTEAGTWRAVFGAKADDTFATWSWARYINTLAAAGKAELNIPAYVNIAAVNTPTTESVQRLLAILHAGAPAIDVVGADLYNDSSPLYREMLQAYGSSGNPLWVSETGTGESYSKFLFYALGDGAIGFSPFGIDFYQGAGLAENYSLLAPMEHELAQWLLDGRVTTVVEEPQHAEQEVRLGKWSATVTFGFPQSDGQRPPGTTDAHGRVLLVQLGPDKFLVTGVDARVIFHLPSRPVTGNHAINSLLEAEQGEYVKGEWRPTRLWNGDETQRGLNFGHEGFLVKATLYTWAGI